MISGELHERTFDTGNVAINYAQGVLAENLIRSQIRRFGWIARLGCSG